MRLTLTNTGNAPVPVMSSDEGGWCEPINPGVETHLDKAGSDVWIIGDKPDVLESIKEGLEVIVKMLTFWKEKQKEVGVEDARVEMTISNNGEKPVRCILGDPTKDITINPGENVDVSAAGYLELRELGG
jgi:hypothetical protein